MRFVRSMSTTSIVKGIVLDPWWLTMLLLMYIPRYVKLANNILFATFCLHHMCAKWCHLACVWMKCTSPFFCGSRIFIVCSKWEVHYQNLVVLMNEMFIISLCVYCSCWRIPFKYCVLFCLVMLSLKLCMNFKFKHFFSKGHVNMSKPCVIRSTTTRVGYVSSCGNIIVGEGFSFLNSWILVQVVWRFSSHILVQVLQSPKILMKQNGNWISKIYGFTKLPWVEAMLGQMVRWWQSIYNNVDS